MMSLVVCVCFDFHYICCDLCNYYYCKGFCTTCTIGDYYYYYYDYYYYYYY